MANATMAHARIWWDFLEKRYWVSFDFSREFVDFLKTTIPKGARRHDPNSKAWSFGKHTSASSKSKPRAPRTEVYNPRLWTVLDFFTALPPEAVAAAYKKAALLCHPDRGGTHEEMIYLNDLWERLQKEFYEQP
jgi:hypothetical protein